MEALTPLSTSGTLTALRARFTLEPLRTRLALEATLALRARPTQKALEAPVALGSGGPLGAGVTLEAPVALGAGLTPEALETLAPLGTGGTLRTGGALGPLHLLPPVVVARTAVVAAVPPSRPGVELLAERTVRARHSVRACGVRARELVLGGSRQGRGEVDRQAEHSGREQGGGPDPGSAQ
ncbi:hypothetical protein ACFV7Q_01660 [Streptomyces sp. NPDC059851]|uniref:hypothetical protein n=1 Tax=Streptomyces sp. NPDC059851 TaxID=3346971 RepID=UPI00365A2B01